MYVYWEENQLLTQHHLNFEVNIYYYTTISEEVTHDAMNIKLFVQIDY